RGSNVAVLRLKGVGYAKLPEPLKIAPAGVLSQEVFVGGYLASGPNNTKLEVSWARINAVQTDAQRGFDQLLVGILKGFWTVDTTGGPVVDHAGEVVGVARPVVIDQKKKEGE